jgi:hypothetical protein
MPQGHSRTSDILLALAASSDGERTSVRTIVGTLGERAYALLIVVLGLPNCLPMPPPIPLMCGLLLVFVALQILFGLRSPWLPQRILNHTIAHADLVRAVEAEVVATEMHAGTPARRGVRSTRRVVK